MSDQLDDLYSLLIPLESSRLIVPRICVAEVTGLGQLQLQEGDPDWLVGKVGWNGGALPLVSFEAARGAQMPEIGSRTRAIIFHAASLPQGNYFALMSQGLPQLVRVNEGVIEADDTEDWPDSAPVICRIRMINEYPLVPDLEAIERMLNESADAWI